MAENLKYNLRDELLRKDEELKEHPWGTLGMNALTLSQYNNSARSVMNTAHLKQYVSIVNPEIPAVFTGAEKIVGDNSSGYKKTKNPVEIVAKVAKFSDILDEPNEYYLFTYDKKNKVYDVISRKEYENLTEVYGFKYDNRVIDELDIGDVVDADKVIFKSNSYDENMNYGYGKNVNILYTSDPATVEDACVPSAKLAKSMVSTEITTYEMGINENDFLLNLYASSKDEYHPFPDIGETAEGLVAAKRTLFNDQLLVDFKDSELGRVHDSDIKLYIEGKGVVTDIEVFCNNPEIEETPFNEQILKYLKSQNKFYKRIVKTCKSIREKCVGIHKKKKSDATFTHEIDYLYKRALDFLDEESKWKDNDSAFGNLQIRITIAKPSGLQPGQKIVARSGNKSVVSEIRDEEDMPYAYVPTPVQAEDGSWHVEKKKRHVDLEYNILGLVNRTTGAPLIEMHINFITERTVQYMWTLKTTKERADIMFQIMADLNERYARSMKKIYDNLSPKEQDEYIDEVLHDRIYICQSPMWEEGKPIFYKFLDIRKKYDFLQPYDIYVYKWGREIKTLRPAYLGSMYFMKLKQTSRKGFSVRGTGSINTKGLPERSYKNKSHTEKYSSTPIRFGEFETLNFTIGMIPEDIQLFHLLYRTSIKGRKEIAKHLLLGDEDGFKISKKYTSRAAEIFAVLLKSLGVKLEFCEEKDEFREYDDKTIRQYELDGKEYLCTEYQFLLVKRRKEIEKAILSERGVIDGDEFEQEVKKRLKEGNFLIGPDESEFDSCAGYLPDTVE